MKSLVLPELSAPSPPSKSEWIRSLVFESAVNAVVDGVNVVVYRAESEIRISSR